MIVVGALHYANIYRTSALGCTHRRSVDFDDSEAVELHRRSLFHPDRYIGLGANVIKCCRASSD